MNFLTWILVSRLRTYIAGGLIVLILISGGLWIRRMKHEAYERGGRDKANEMLRDEERRIHEKVREKTKELDRRAADLEQRDQSIAAELRTVDRLRVSVNRSIDQKVGAIAKQYTEKVNDVSQKDPSQLVPAIRALLPSVRTERESWESRRPH